MTVDQQSIRILFLLPDFPYPPSTGGRSKIFYELRYLSSRHQCDILCFGKADDAQMSGLASVLPRVGVLGVMSPRSSVSKWFGMLWNLVRLLPLSMAAFAERNYAQAVRDSLATGDYDVVHYDIVNMAQYLPLGSGKPSVHSPSDATSLVYFRMAGQSVWSLDKIRLLFSAILLRRFERRMYPLFTKVHVVSQVDTTYLRKLDPRIDIVTIPITIDDGFLIEADILGERCEAPEYRPKIVCTGNFGNPGIAKGIQEFLRDAYPLILQKIPNTQLVVLGQNANASLQQQFKDSTNVEFCTWVEDYRSFLAQADVVLAPDCAGPPGAKTRVVQAMGLGLPVVGTEIAFEGIPAINGVHGLVYRSTPECAELMLALLSNRKMRGMVGEKAHQLAIAEFALSEVGPRYETLYKDAISKHKSILYNAGSI